MAKYLWLRATQEPFDDGLDGKNRIIFCFNIMVRKGYSRTFVEEIVKKLADDGVGTAGVNILWSSKVEIPAGNGPFLHIRETGGTGADHTHNETTRPAYQQPGAQIKVYASTNALAKGMIWAAYESLVGVNKTLVP